MIPREKIIVAASGKPGEHGIQYHGQRDAVAQAGRNGANGRSSCTATDGTDGQDVCVNLSHLKDTTSVLVTGEKTWAGTRWEVSKDQILLLDCKGGDGGDGGRGEDGQQGGQGARGRDATKHRSAENGGTGARGGDGGNGTNGAKGGRAGNILISVKEDDMDLLLTVYWDIRGGSGGKSGTHGDPGDGGIGGDGGSGITWTERHGNTVTKQSRPPGLPGHTGAPGARPPTYLAGGSSGAQGSSQVRVLLNNGAESTYPSGYQLKVVSFDIVDENGDRINEPGEHLIVKNVRVENVGGMPSPTAAEIKVLIHGTHWLDPIVSEPIFLPKAIPVGATVEVPGVLRAFIMQERSVRGPGQLLRSSDEIQLIATATRLDRTVPDFSGSTKIFIQYPLQLDPPRYLDCVAQGDQVTFSWTLRNVSTKPYGLGGTLGRTAGTCLADPGCVFEFVDAGNNKHKMADFLETLDPGSEVPISQTFKVSALAMPYSEGHLTLDLLLSEPGVTEARFSNLPPGHEEYPELRTVAHYDIRLQISGVYSYNPQSSFLLVINAQTPNTMIHKIIGFVRNDLRLALDIFNLSVTGSFTNNNARKNTLLGYVGKSIIICGDQFNYFSRGKRTALSFIEPCLACYMLKAGTSMMIAGTSSEGEVQVSKGWATSVIFPLIPYNCLDQQPSANGSTPAFSWKDFKRTLFGTIDSTASGPLPRHSFVSTVKCFTSKDAALASDAQKARKHMVRCFPLRRFAITTDASTAREKTCGSVMLQEGLPLTAKLVATKLTLRADNEDLAEYSKYLIVSTLPFNLRAAMFWNMVGQSVQGGVEPEILFYGKSSANGGQGVTVSVTEQKAMVSEQICKAVAHSVEYDLGRELFQYKSSACWPDVIPKEKAFEQLPLLSQFFAAASPTSRQAKSTEGADFLIQTISAINSSVVPVSWGEVIEQAASFGLSRRARLASEVLAKIDHVLCVRFDPAVIPALKDRIASSVAGLKQELSNRASENRSTAAITLASVASWTGVGSRSPEFFTDVSGTIAPETVNWSGGNFPKDLPDHDKVAAFVKADEEHSRGMLDEMVESG